MKQLYFAPVQGHTDAAYRHFHSKLYGGNLTYYTPFIRLEKDEIRTKDLKDLKSELNQNHNLVPQIIFRDKEELNKLVEKINDLGFTAIDLNMGCPFPLQTSHHRGAATVSDEELAKEIVKCVSENPDINFSIKMRLGMTEPDEWEKTLPILNDAKLSHITIHPRVAKQQYGGEVDMGQFSKFLQSSKNPVVYNGDLTTPEEVTELIKKYPEISGIMIARGALGRPSLFNEINSGVSLSQEERIGKMKNFHRDLFNHYSEVLCGDTQILSKIKPFWEYAENEIGRKTWKNIKKAVNLSKYQTALANL